MSNQHTRRAAQSPQMQQDIALLVYAGRMNGTEGFRKEAARLILARDLKLYQAQILVETAKAQIEQVQS